MYIIIDIYVVRAPARSIALTRHEQNPEAVTGASCLKSPQTPNMPASHLSHLTNLQTALSLSLMALTVAATAVTGAAAVAAYFLGGITATVRNLLVVDHVPGSAPQFSCSV